MFGSPMGAARPIFALLLLFASALPISAPAMAEPAYPATLAPLVDQYPGSSVTMTQKTRDASHTVLQTADTPKKVIEFYRSAATAKGWQIVQESATAEAQIIEAFKDDHTFTVTAVAGDAGVTLITLILTQ